MQPTIYAVGFGPGDVLHMTTQAVSVLETVDVIVGYTTYIQLLQEQFPDKQFRSTRSNCIRAGRCRSDCSTGGDCCQCSRCDFRCSADA